MSVTNVSEWLIPFRCQCSLERVKGSEASTHVSTRAWVNEPFTSLRSSISLFILVIRWHDSSDAWPLRGTSGLY